MMIFDHQQLRAYFRAAVQKHLQADPGEFQFEYPPSVEMGDLAMNFPFALARQLRKPPRKIAEEAIAAIPAPEGVARMEAAGAGYINLFFDRHEVTRRAFREPEKKPTPESPHIIVEHTSINPNKAAHIGHLRNSCLGDSMARLLRYLGENVTVQNYIDDTGVQVADVVVGFMHIDKKTKEEIIAIPEPFDYYCWDLYAKVGSFYKEDESRLKLKRSTLHAMEAGEGPEAAIGTVVAERILRCHLKTMERLGIMYDLLIWEGHILQEQFWLEAFELLKKSGVLYHADSGQMKGCWVMDLSKSEAFENMDDPDKIIVRSDGTVTYVGKDIAYHLWKFGKLGKDFHYRKYNIGHDGELLWTSTLDEETEPYEFKPADTIFNVIDVGQEYPQKVVRESIRAIAGKEAAEGYNHLSYEKVALTPASCERLGVELDEEEKQKAFIAMSGRRGLGVKATDLHNMLEEQARIEVSKRNPEFSEQETAQVAAKLATGALRYYMIKFTRKQILAFDFEAALSFEGDSGPYLTYAMVRANNIMAKLRKEGLEEKEIDNWLDTIDFSAIETGPGADDLWELVQLINRTESAARDAIRTLELSVFTRHAYSLAQAFNAWYHKYPILNEENASVKQMRTVVLQLFRKSFGGILHVMGIPVPDRM